MKHSMSTSSQCLSPSTLLDDPRLRVPSPGATLRTYCLLLVHLDPRSDLDPFAAFVMELPAPLASSLPLDPGDEGGATPKDFDECVS
ncbi:hypothetical protein GUJ93_ZPchr0009g2400 [Zizania palustris]|uniref:Uncharacterized protein n=1 Tax=Zizania palustris TaxID=103762 RepID=A0A8J5S247_ZIZPA|nr:hypothetical protein GUJ93_ZPchr0009g2400 [Zizania palustris]